MKYIFQNLKLKKLYIFFLFSAVLNIFFSTGISLAKTFSINDIELSTPFKINFDKDKIIEEGFIQAFDQLILSIVQSKDHKRLKKIKINQIKSMIDTFSIKEEKFVSDIYYIKLNVSFNKKIVFDLFEKENIFPSLPVQKDIIFIPIIVDLNKNQVKMYSDNIIYNLWNVDTKSYNLLNYILPTEDLEDINLVKKNIENLENFEFKEVVNKYNLENYIISIFFISSGQTKLLNKINFDNKKILKNILLKYIDFNNKPEINKLIETLKISFEDYWKSQNEINTSVKLPLTISVKNINNIKINEFEKKLSNLDLIYNFYIYKFDNKNNIYKIIFNGTPDKFIEVMKNNNYELETTNNIWVVK